MLTVQSIGSLKFLRRVLLCINFALIYYLAWFLKTKWLGELERQLGSHFCEGSWTVLVFDDRTSEALKLLSHCAVLIRKEKSVFWENEAYMSVPNSPGSAYIGLVAFPLYKETKIPIELASITTAIHDGMLRNSDVVAFISLSLKNVEQAVFSHGERFVAAWDMLLQGLGHTLETIRSHDDVSGFYCNAWVAKRFVYNKYSKFVSRALDLVKNNSTLRAILMADSGYMTLPGQVDTVLEVYNVSFVPLLPFVLERLPAFYFASRKYRVHIHREVPEPIIPKDNGVIDKSALETFYEYEYRRAAFSLVGIPKSGTTALLWYLEDHPSVARVIPKETCFHDSPSRYMEHINKKPICNGCVFGDSCLKLFQSHDDVHRLYAQYVLSSNSTMILLVRNPLSRIYASYWYWCTEAERKRVDVREYCDQHGNWNPRKTITLRDNSTFTFRRSAREFHSACLAGACADIPAFSLSKSVRNLLQLYGKRLLIVSTEQLYNDSVTVLNLIISQLGLQQHDFANVSQKAVNVNGLNLNQYVTRKRRGEYSALLPETVAWAEPYLLHECKSLEIVLPACCLRWGLTS